MKRFIAFFIVCLIVNQSVAQNRRIDSLSDAKHILQDLIYTDYFETIYCGATYHPKTKKIIAYPDVFNETVIANRSERIEYEHIVPVENFGRTFKEWRKGDKRCVSKGIHYKGRKCANKVNKKFRLMQADMYNLYPSVGSVNAIRMNKPFIRLPQNIEPVFGTSCLFKVADNSVEPPDRAKGIVARTYLYFSEVYPKRFQLNTQQLHQMIDWHIQYPVTEWECTRTARIEAIQKSENLITKEACQKAGLWVNTDFNKNLNNQKQYIEKEEK